MTRRSNSVVPYNVQNEAELPASGESRAMPIVWWRPPIQCHYRDSNGYQRTPGSVKDEVCCGFRLPT